MKKYFHILHFYNDFFCIFAKSELSNGKEEFIVVVYGDTSLCISV